MKRLLIACAILADCAFAQSGLPTVTTGQYNTARTAANLDETILNPSNVNTNQFGKLFSLPVDGWIFAQPLYVAGVQIAGATRNVVYVATMHNSVYAFDADSTSATPLWHVNFGTSVKAQTSNGCPYAGSTPVSGTGPELGILSTPVIDPSRNTLYAVAATPSGGGFVHYLHALDITSGQEKSGSPVQIQASVAGNGYDSQGGTVTLSPASANIQRTALLLANGSVYAGFGNCGPDNDPWHGWVVGYSTANLNNQTLVFNSTPNGGQGGIWQSGRGLVADASGNIYFNTGNATTRYAASDSNITTGNSTTDAKHADYPMRFVQLLSTGQFGGSYPPANYAALNQYDLDFSSSGPLLIPGTNLLVAGGKDGMIYVFNPNNLANPQQSFQATGTSTCSYSDDGCDQIHDLAFWNDTLYVWGSNDILRAYTLNPSTNRFNTSPASQNNNYTVGYYAPSLAVSANSTQDGILWAITANKTVHAFDALNLGTELWNSTQNANRDALPGDSYPKFVEPTVANGRVYVASHSNQVLVYGLLSDFTLSSSVESEAVDQRGSGTFTVTVTSLSNSSSAATFSISGLPSGVTATFSPSSVNGSGSSTVTINAASSTATGTYNLIVSATRGGVTRTTSVSLTVNVAGETTTPQWSCCTVTTNGSTYVLTFSAWDTQSGLKSIQVVQEVNATASIPQFPVGTHSVVHFTATETVGKTSYVVFKLTDVAGNVSYVNSALVHVGSHAGQSGAGENASSTDASVTNGTNQTDPPAPFAIKYVGADQGFVTIQNGTPGLTSVRLEISKGSNIEKIEVADLKGGETRVVNIVRQLPPAPSVASVTVTPLGKPGGTALLVFASSPMKASPQ